MNNEVMILGNGHMIKLMGRSIKLIVKYMGMKDKGDN